MHKLHPKVALNFFDQFVLDRRSGKLSVINNINSRCCGVSKLKSEWVSGSNLIRFTSFPTGFPFGSVRELSFAGGACFWDTFIPRFDRLLLPSRFLSAPSVIIRCRFLSFFTFNCILSTIFSENVYRTPEFW